jgi:hypothetical protein
MTAGARIGWPDATTGARRGPREPGYRLAGITPGQVAEARKDLGRRLAAWRGAAEMTQVELARRISYSRSTVASVETGRHCAPRKFWQYADREVGAAGGLLAAFDQVDALVRALQTQAAQARERQRAAKYAPLPRRSRRMAAGAGWRSGGGPGGSRGRCVSRCG